MEGTTFGRYRLIELLDRGGRGECWRAHDTEADRAVAVQVLPAGLDEDLRARFLKEARVISELTEPHVMHVDRYGTIDGRLYVEMRFIEGRGLHAILRDGPLEPERAVNVVVQVARAAHAAHAVGLAHSAITPASVVVADDDFAYLMDFGLARSGDGGAGDSDARADVYGLTCLLYECLTGTRPTPSSPPPTEVLPRLPRGFDVVISGGMSLRGTRHASAIEFARAAERANTTKPHGQVKAFISYSRRDQRAVQLIAASLKSAKVEVWFDDALRGGESWWAEILEQIRQSSVLVFAVSDHSLRSKPCNAEMEYASQLGIQVVPAKVGELTTYRSHHVMTRQLVDLTTTTPIIALVDVLYDATSLRPPLPDPLPEPPQIPYAYLHRIGALIRNAGELSPSVQRQMLSELRVNHDDEREPGVVQEIREVLSDLLARQDVTRIVAADIELLLASEPQALHDLRQTRGSVPPEPVGPPPVADATITDRLDVDVVTFGWPEGAAAVLAFLGPLGIDIKALCRGTPKVELTRHAHERDGGFLLESTPLTGYTLCLVPVSYPVGRQPIRGGVVRLEHKRPTRLRYWFIHSTDRGREFATLWLEPEAQIERPLSLVLMRGGRRLPLSVEDADQELVRWQSPEDGSLHSLCTIDRVLSGQTNTGWKADLSEVDGFIRVFHIVQGRTRPYPIFATPPRGASWLALLDPPLDQLWLDSNRDA